MDNSSLIIGQKVQVERVVLKRRRDTKDIYFLILEKESNLGVSSDSFVGIWGGKNGTCAQSVKS